MKIALLSDIHGNRWALDAVLAHAARHQVEEIWNLGDLLSGPLDVAATADRLIALGALTIGGNHERQLLACADGPGLASDEYAFHQTTAAHRAWLRALPATARPRADVLLCHGTPGSDLAPLAETHEPERGLRLATLAELRERAPLGAGHASPRLIACGHTHLPRVVQLTAECLVVNPGSVGLQAYDYTEDGRVYYVDNGTPHACYAIVEELEVGVEVGAEPGANVTASASAARGTARWQASLHRVPYDWEAAAALAERNQRVEWAYALRTGYALRATPSGAPDARPAG